MKSPLPKNPHSIIQIGGATFDSWRDKQLFETVRVELTTNQLCEARWQCFDPKFKVIDRFTNPTGVPMLPFAVWLGYGKNLGAPIFQGLLAHVERGESATTFIAFDMGFKMKLIKKAGYKNKKNDLEILEFLANRNGLSFEGPDEPLNLEPYQALMQDEQTDWEWAMERARDAGLVLFVRNSTLYAKKPAKVKTPVLTLVNHKDFTLTRDWDFIHKTPESQDSRPRIVERRARNAGGRRLAGRSDVSSRGRTSVVLKRDVPSPTPKRVKQRAQAQKDLDREHAFEGRVRTTYPTNGERLDVRNTVMIQEIGKLFSGAYICDTVGYFYSPGELGLDLELYRDINA